MASLNVMRICFLQPPGYGTWTTGDVVDIYWDTTTQVFSVKKNGVDYPQTGSEYIDNAKWIMPGFYDYRDYYTLTTLIPDYCLNTTRVSFSNFYPSNGFIYAGSVTSWPYCFANLTENDNLCAVTPVIQDIAWSGAPAITNATSTSQQDGSITYSATSSYGPVRYSMFYNSYALGVSSPTFSNLAPGSYTLYAIDSKGFWVSYTFTIQDLSANIPPPPVLVCDIQFPGTPSITQDTGPANGAITFMATSGHPPIQYALRNFNYNDGNGQASSTFSNLPASNYILYAVDSANCKASYQFTIPLNAAPSTPPASSPTQQIIYQMVMPDWDGKISVINFVKKQWSATPIQIDGGTDNPIILTSQLIGSTDKYASVNAQSLDIYLKSPSPNYFQEFFTASSDAYTVQYYKDQALQIVAKIRPQSYMEPYSEYSNFPVKLTATCGLVELDDLDFLDDTGDRFKGRQKEIVLIANALRKTGLGLKIRSACNLFATGMATTAADDPLAQAYADPDAYYQNGEALSCLEVIKRIIEPYCATITQWGGYWYIVRFEELVSTSVPYREFDIYGAYSTNGTFNPIVNIKREGYTQKVKIIEGATIDMIPPAGNIEMTYHQGLMKSLVKNYNFEVTDLRDIQGNLLKSIDMTGFTLFDGGSEPYGITTSFTTLDGKETDGVLILEGTGKGYAIWQWSNFKMFGTDKLAISLKYKIDAYQILFRYQKITMQVTLGVYYMRADGSWSKSPTFITIYESDQGKYKEFKVTADQPTGTSDPDGIATSGLQLVVRIYTSYVLAADNTTVAGIRAITTVGLPPGYRTEYNDGTYMYYYELENNTSAESVPSIVRPTDYNAGTNPYQWILKQQTSIYNNLSLKGKLYIDQIKVDYQPGGSQLVEDSVESLAPQFSRSVMKKEVYHGSILNNAATYFSYGLSVNANGGTSATFTSSWAGNANPTLTFRNWLSKSDGSAWTTWKRNAVTELERLQTIALKSYAAQYKKSTRRIQGSVSNKTDAGDTKQYVTPITMLKDNYDGRFYRPLGYSYYDRQCQYDGSLVEIFDITAGGTDTTGGTSTYNSAFNSAFGS